jgi:chromate transport protein ChrA
MMVVVLMMILTMMIMKKKEMKKMMIMLKITATIMKIIYKPAILQKSYKLSIRMKSKNKLKTFICSMFYRNWWMIFAFILVGLFIIFVVTVSIFLIVKQKNKKKEQVGTRQSNGGK